MSYSVPLYTYSDPDFSLPISLDYNYSGYRPSQHSGYVGLGWNLNCGGVITREIVGLPDDYDYNGLRGFYYLATSTAAATLRDSIANGSYTTTFDSFDFANYFCHTSPYVPDDQSVSTYFGTTARNAAVSYGYDELGRQSFTSDDGLVQLNQYTLQGWMLRKNVAQNDNMIFWEILRYADPAYSGLPRYNGTLSEVAWNPEGGSPTTTYAFEYDGAGRLKNTARIYGGNVNNAYTERNLTYDRNGNILSLKRYGTSSSAPADNFSYTYAGNRLSQLNGSSYAYDDNCNMTADGRQGLEMEYNVLNLPRRIEDAQTGVGVSYSYLADGTKAEMRRDDGTGLAYAGDMVFTRGANGAYTFETAAYCNGRLLSDGSTQKFVTDHLGSVRAVVTGGQVVERNDYYPLGMRHPNPSYTQLTANRYGYNGKERQDIATSGTYLDYGARFLDPVLGRWTTTDPMAEKYLSLTPYNFCGNDAINRYDPDGRTDYFNYEGQLIYRDCIDNGLMRISSKEQILNFLSNFDMTHLNTETYIALYTNSLSIPDALRNSVIDKIVLLNIYSHYNYTGLPLREKRGYNFSFDSSDSNDLFIGVDLDRNSSNDGLNSNSYDIINLINGHEWGHYKDWEDTRFKGHDVPYWEIKAIEYQKMHDSWIKTSKEFKEQINLYYDYWQQYESK